MEKIVIDFNISWYFCSCDRMLSVKSNLGTIESIYETIGMDIAFSSHKIITVIR